MPVIATPPVCRVAANSTLTRSTSDSVDTARHRARTGQHVARPDLLAEADTETAHAARAQPVGGEPGQQRRGEHALREYRGVAGGLRELIVVMHGVEVTGRAGVADEHLPGQRSEIAGRSLRADTQSSGRRQLRTRALAGTHRWAVSMKVALASATSAPSASRYSVTTVAKRIVPPRLPGFE